MTAPASITRTQLQSIFFNLFLALLATFGITRIVELVQFGAVTRFFPLNLMMVVLAVVGIAIILCEPGRSDQLTAIAFLIPLILIILAVSQIVLVVSILAFLGVVFNTSSSKILSEMTLKKT